MVQKLDNYYLAVAIQKFSKYFSLTTPQETAGAQGLQAIQGFSNRYPNSRLQPDPVVTNLMDILVNTNYGAVPTYDPDTTSSDLLHLIDQFTTQPNSAPTANGAGIAQNFADKIKIFHGIQGFEKPWAFPVIGNMLNIADGQGNDLLTRISAIQINAPQISPANKYTEAISIFMNGIPSIEMARAVPFIDIKFQFGREAIDSNGYLNATSIFKFLEGAVRVTNDSNLARMALSNRVSGSISGASNDSGYLSVAGMELFTAPQTMVNANTPNPAASRGDGDLRTTAVLDKFRPFASFKTLTIDVAPSVGLMSFKTAKMEFVLHDRSRLHEIADLIRPDLYGTTELIIEYGWSHPDSPSSGNQYAVLLNCTRIKEKYGIRNMQLNIDEVGQANITLDLFTRGANELATESIGTANERTQRSLQVIQRLSETVRLLRERVFRNNSSNQNSSGGGTNREIRGTQVLDAASDIQNNIRLSPDILTGLDQLTADLRRSGNNPNTSALLNSLRELYNSRTSDSRISNQNTGRTNNGGAVFELQRSIQQEIEAKLNAIKETYDPFYPPPQFTLPRGSAARDGSVSEAAIGDQDVANNNRNSPFRRVILNHAGREVAPTPTSGTSRRPPTIDASAFNNTFFSLGKLLMAFVGQPLATHTDKFSSVQFLFYPFNSCAGYANGLNISQFMVDTRYFIEQYVRFRTENVTRAANVTLNEFLQFISSTIIDDPGAAIYGIDDLYERVINRDTGQATLQPRGNSVEFQTRLENRLKTKTPDSSFKMPHLSFYVEALPKRRVNPRNNTDSQTGLLTVNDPESAENGATILRIHVFDQQTTQYEGQGALLAACRDNALNTISAIPAGHTSGEPAILDGHRAAIRQIINMAQDDENLIEPIPRDNQIIDSSPSTAYRINGGANAIKQFVMRTMPYVIYGAQGTNVIHADVTSQNEPALSTVNMLRNNRASPIRASGEQFGGIPLTVIPMEVSLTTMGCSLISFAQQMFIDFQTGTSIDNIYGVCGLTHKIEAGSFITTAKFAPLDAYGRYSSFLERINNFVTNLNDIQGSQNGGSANNISR